MEILSNLAWPDSLISGEEEDFLKDEEEDINEKSGPLFPDEIEKPEIQIFEEKNEQKNEINNSNRFNIFHLFNPKLIENNQNKENDEININKNHKKNILFLSRKKERKEMKDNILKKVKSRFFKNVKKRLKERLTKVHKSENSFNFLSQKFISDVTKKNNELIWEEKFSEFLELKLIDNNKHEILKSLEKEKIGEITLRELYNEYLNSQEFEDSIPKNENEKNVTETYIKDYINNAKNFINYFTGEKKNSKKGGKNKMIIEDESIINFASEHYYHV